MEASLRLFTSTSHLDRRLPISIKATFQHRHPLKRSNPELSSTAASLSASSSSYRSSNALPFLLSLTLSGIFSSSSSSSSPPYFNFDRSAPSAVDAKQERDRSRNWPAEGDAGGGRLGFGADGGGDLMVVLLGWLGAEKRHLKRYAELYTARGIRTVEFVVPLKGLLGLDLGRRVEDRVMAFAGELIEWLSETEKKGEERGLLFHTFSNTGWLAYGAILEDFQQRGDYMKRIKGCVIDSGGDPEINPQVWAAGFSAALLKKHSSSAVSLLLLSILETFFSHILKLPRINRRLSDVISVLFNHQPPCPQLYLYSAGDKVIPHRSIEYFIEEQRKSGRPVWAHNFGSSPHVDHFRSFPHIYSEKLYQFLDFFILKVGQT